MAQFREGGGEKRMAGLGMTLLRCQILGRARGVGQKPNLAVAGGMVKRH